jgi:arginyl-tRNA synthetase
MRLVHQIKVATTAALRQLYGKELQPEDILVNATKPEFTGDYTIVLFAMVKSLKTSPDALGQALGSQLVSQHPHLFQSFNIIKGFLNLEIPDTYWQQFVTSQYAQSDFGIQPNNSVRVMVEYSSPNTNKPLHLGHLRNNFLGSSLSAILKATGNEVIKTCIVNDRGIHICKSMIAWQRFANGATPASTQTKGDHFVGNYYVLFNNALQAEIAAAVASGQTKEQAEKEVPIMKAAQEMLLEWEKGNPEVLELWKTMNEWVYAGFAQTYQRIGSEFDKTYYESNTYLLGKNLVQQGLEKKVFYQKPDGSVWIDLTADGLDEKLVQRSDGTSVYITQDIGLAEQKQSEFNTNQSIYVVGDEQNYHFKVLKLICEHLKLPSAEGIYHLSYGMVELPTGKMKSREGTVVDADDLVDNMIRIAAEKTAELGKVNDFTVTELQALNEMIGIGALKFFLLRVDPKKKMLFNPEESIDFHGFTGPFIQYTHARIKSILRKTGTAAEQVSEANPPIEAWLAEERELATTLETFPTVLEEAALQHDPSQLAIYTYQVAKTFNSLYAAHSIAGAATMQLKIRRLHLAELTAHVIKTSMQLLGIAVPERM